MNNLSQAYLYIGPEQEILNHTYELLFKVFCKNNVCKVCSECLKISHQQHSNIVWLKPEKQYTLDLIEDVLKTISLALSVNEKFFFIFQNADFLTQSCSNSLLKSIEEPPAGYHFIFLAKRKDQILPTIRSRCIIKSFYSGNELEYFSELSKFFIESTDKDPSDFLKTLEKIQINERESFELLDYLINYWSYRNKHAIINKQMDYINFSHKILNILHNATNNPPMPGSSKIFWRNIFLSIINLNY